MKMVSQSRRAPFSPIGEKVSFAFVQSADEGRLRRDAALTPSLSPRGERGNHAGFSLIESITIIAIISILTAISVSALPAIRAHQALVADTEQIRSLLLDSKQRSLNQVRPAACVEANGGIDDERSQRCSDVGIVFSGGNIIQFADTKGNITGVGGNLRYDAGDTGDYPIASHPLQSLLVNEPSTNHFLFYGNPPSVDLFADGILVEPNQNKTILLEFGTGKDRAQRTLEVSSFGTIDIK